MKGLKIISSSLFKKNNSLYTNKLVMFNITSLFIHKNSLSAYSNTIYNYPHANFAKKGGEKNDKKAKKEKEKETINKEYANVSVEELKSKYKSKTDNILTKFKEELNEIRVQRSNPKILDSTQITIKNKRNKLSDIATIMLRSSNVLVINPFDESHKDSIIKSIEGSKLDVQITTEGNSIVVTLGAIPNEMKNECLIKAKKLFEGCREEFKELRHSIVTEMKRLEKIMGQDEARRIEKGILEFVEKGTKQIDQAYKKKEEEIKSS